MRTLRKAGDARLDYLQKVLEDIWRSEMKILIEESVLRQALGALNAWGQLHGVDSRAEAITNLRAAIKAMEDAEPVAWMDVSGRCGGHRGEYDWQCTKCGKVDWFASYTDPNKEGVKCSCHPAPAVELEGDGSLHDFVEPHNGLNLTFRDSDGNVTMSFDGSEPVKYTLTHAEAEAVNRLLKGTAMHWVSASCGGENCNMCGAPATHKVCEEIQWDDPNKMRHNFTAYVCCNHFMKIFGRAVGCGSMALPSREMKKPAKPVFGHFDDQAHNA